MNKSISFFIVSILSFQLLNATTWGGSGNDYGYQIIHTSDNGFAILGQIENQSPDNYLIKLDSAFNVQWTKTYGDAASYDYPIHLSQSYNDGYLIAGAELNSTKATLLKLNSNGDTIWNQSYGNNPNIIYTMVFAGQFSINQYTIGIVEAPFTGGSMLYLCHADTLGNITDTITNVNSGEKVIPVSNGFLITGTISYLTPPAISLSRVDTVTGHSFTKTYYDASLNRDFRANTSDFSGTGFMTAGTSNFFTSSPNEFEFYLMKTDANGDSIWSKRWGSFHSELFTLLASGNYFYASGVTDSSSFLENMIMKLDSAGDTVWVMHLGHFLNVSSMLETSPGYFAAVGDSMNSTGINDIWLMRFDSLGNVVSNTPTGIKKTIQLKTMIDISPNPASDFIKVTVHSPISGMSYRALIVDSNGKAIQQYSISENALQIDIKNYPAGPYFLRIMDEHGDLVGVKKFFRK